MNRNGSISIYLGEGVSLTGGQKRYMRAAQSKTDENASAAVAK